MSSRGDAAGVADIHHELATLRLDDSRSLVASMVKMRELLDVEATCLYGVAESATGWELSRLDTSGFPHGFSARFSKFLASAPRRWGVYDAGRPEPAQRNRIFEPLRHVSPSDAQISTVFHRVFSPAGLGDHGHLRVLLCEGASLLGWFGLLSRDPFTQRHRRILRALSRPMHRRLLVERQLQRGHLAAAALEALLEAIAEPAFILDVRGRIREANAAARALLRERDRDIRHALADTVARRPSNVAVRLTRLHERGLGTHWLAVVAIDTIKARVAAVAERYRFTPREIEVLSWLARGATNQRIAAELACSERTVEAHITNMLTKADVASRTALVALLLA